MLISVVTDSRHKYKYLISMKSVLRNCCRKRERERYVTNLIHDKQKIFTRSVREEQLFSNPSVMRLKDLLNELNVAITIGDIDGVRLLDI